MPLLKLLYKHRDKKSILILTKTDLVKDFAKRQIIQDKLTGRDSSKPKVKQFGVRASLERAHMEELFRLTEAKQWRNHECSYDEIRPIEENQKHWPHFARVFQTSAFDSTGIDKLRQYFLESAYPNPWLYNRDCITDRDPSKVIVNIIKSKIMDNVASGPTPYNLHITIVEWVINEASIDIIAKCTADNDFYIRQIIGPKGRIIFKVNNQVREALSQLYRCEVNFRLDLHYTQDDDKKEKKKQKEERKEKKNYNFKKKRPVDNNENDGRE